MDKLLGTPKSRHYGKDIDLPKATARPRPAPIKKVGPAMQKAKSAMSRLKGR